MDYDQGYRFSGWNQEEEEVGNERQIEIFGQSSSAASTSRPSSSVVELPHFRNPNYAYVPGSSFTYMQVPTASTGHIFQNDAVGEDTNELLGSEQVHQADTSGHQYLNTNTDSMAPFVMDDDVNVHGPMKQSMLHSSGRKRMDKTSDEYRKRRERNNVAVRKSREKAKMKSRETEERVGRLLRENEQLQKRIEMLQEELSVLRSMFSTVDPFPDQIH